MIPEDTKSKEQTDMSATGGPPEQTEEAPDLAAMGIRPNAGHSVVVNGLKAFYGTSEAVRGIDITFPANEVTAIIGPSGCGKSTMVRCINRMHEEIPGAHAEGSVKLDD